MKKLAFVFHAFAFVLAIGAAYAASSLPTQIGYVKTGIPLQPCQQVTVDCPGGSTTCEDASRIVYDGTTLNSTSCGEARKFNP